MKAQHLQPIRNMNYVVKPSEKPKDFTTESTVAVCAVCRPRAKFISSNFTI